MVKPSSKRRSGRLKLNWYGVPSHIRHCLLMVTVSLCSCSRYVAVIVDIESRRLSLTAKASSPP